MKDTHVVFLSRYTAPRGCLIAISDVYFGIRYKNIYFLCRMCKYVYIKHAVMETIKDLYIRDRKYMVIIISLTMKYAK